MMKKLFIYTAMISLVACSKDDGPAAEDHFMNYEIPEVPVTENYTVGAFYYEVGNFNANIKEEPVVGKYSMPNGVVNPTVMTKHLEYATKAGLDYFLFSSRSANRDNGAYKRD